VRFWPTCSLLKPSARWRPCFPLFELRWLSKLHSVLCEQSQQSEQLH